MSSPSKVCRGGRFRVGIAAALVAAALAGCAGSDAVTDAVTGGLPAVPARDRPIPVHVDYSPTLSDAGALLYLAASPAYDLRAVTLAGTGESRCAAAVPTTLALLASAGRGDVPVACGSTEPVGPGHAWPDAWRAAADTLLDPLDLEPAGAADDTAAAAVDLLADTARETDGLVVVALGPLTNLARAVTERPEFVDAVAMTYVMGGAVAVAGNAPNGVAEWNVYADPIAAAVVVRSGLAITLVPLDATRFVPADAGLAARMPAGPLRELWEVGKPWQTGLFLWDELTAVLAGRPELARVGPMRIDVVTEGTEVGRTVADAAGREVMVVGRPDRRAVEDEFLAGLAGGVSA